MIHIKSMQHQQKERAKSRSFLMMAQLIPYQQGITPASKMIFDATIMLGALMLSLTAPNVPNLTIS